jgi:PelA/Pel-15E family pectate lyase
MSRFSFAFVACAFVAPSLALPAVVGTNPPARPLTSQLISELPAAEQPVWQQYLARSKKHQAIDEAFLAKELDELNLTEPIIPPKGKPVSLRQPEGWYASDEAQRFATMVISFQTPSGGWNKNTKMTDHFRKKGERFGLEEGYVGTFDNDATITELRFLAKVAAATDVEHGASFRAAFARGAEYIFAAQYPNGGWPQVWPLEGGYHDAITFNDGAMTHVLGFVRDLAAGRNEFSFASADLRSRAAASLNRGLDCMLKSQITVGGRRTVWCQQFDVLTLQPTSARNYEMPSESSSESAEMMMFLMEIERPTPPVIAAVHSAAAWFKKTAITGKAFRSTGEDGRHLVDAPGAKPLWARYYEIGADRPLFGDRDKTIHDNIDEISKERRNGYSWFNGNAEHILAHYEKWANDHPLVAAK